MRVLVWHIPHPALVHLLSSTSAGQYVWCAQPGQVPKAAHFPLLKAGSMFCFPTGTIIWPPSLSLQWPEGHHKHRETLITFTQQALNDSRESLSLPNTEMSSVRKTILPNRMALDTIIASKRHLCLSPNRMFYVHTRESLLIKSPRHK